MLPVDNRLKRSGGFKAVYDRGRSYAADLVVLYALPKRERTKTRFGFSVSKKIGGSVQRNRARRLIREAVRLLLPRVLDGWDVVIIARRSIVGAEFSDVMLCVEKLLERAGVIAAGEDTPGK
jgi:ribonuclease P protein component